MSLYIGILASQGSGGALLDSYGGAAAAFSLRKLSSTYGGAAVRVRRSLDNTEQDIGFAGGQLDQAALQAFVGYENLISYSEQLNDASWSKNASSITVNATTAPNGTLTADAIIEDTANSTHNITRLASPITTVAGQTYTFSIYLKQAFGTRNVYIAPVASTASGNTNGVLIDVSNGTYVGASNVGVGNAFTANDVSIQSIGNGWYRVSVKVTTSGSPYYILVGLSDGLNTSYTGNGTSGVYAWGAQLNQGVTAQPYQVTTATANTANGFVTKWYTQDGNGENLFTYSEQFDNAIWKVFGGATKTGTNVAAAPNGTLTADSIRLTTANIGSNIYQEFASASANVYNVSFWVKRNAATDQTFQLFINIRGTLLLSGNLTATDTWQRFNFTGNYFTGSTPSVFGIIGNTTGTTSDLLVWGAQLSATSWLQGYQATTTTAVSRRDASQATAASQPRIVNAGVIERENGKPAVYFNGTSGTELKTTYNVPINASTFLATFRRHAKTGVNIEGIFNGDGGSGGIGYYNFSPNAIQLDGSGANPNISASLTNNLLAHYIMSGLYTGSTTSGTSLFANGYYTNIFTGTGVTRTAPNPLAIGGRTGGGQTTWVMKGTFQEGVLYNSNMLSSITAMNLNQNSYYQVYWQGTQQALLDQFGGSAAAFSLRNLSSSYRGPLVRVRRSSDNAETDIGGTFSGDLDVNSLLAFTGGQNLILQSEDFTNASWFKIAVTATSNATIAPDGALTADKISETATTSEHGVNQITSTISGPHTISMYVKAAERNIIDLSIFQNGGNFPYYAIGVDLTTGQTRIFTGSGGLSYSNTVTNVGNGWWRISVSGTTNVTAALTFLLAIRTGTVNNPVNSYLGVAGSGVYVWGAQLTTGSVLQPYIPTTTAVNGANAFVTKWYTQDNNYQNLVLQSQTFENAYWFKLNISVTQDVIAAPDGTLTAEKVIEAVGTNAKYLYPNGGFAVSANTYTGSVYAKAGERSRLVLGIWNGSNYELVQFDLSNGTIVQEAVAGIASISSVGNGWYRCTVTRTIGSVTTYLSFGPHVSTNIGTLTGPFPTYTGDGNSGIYIWGAQANQGELVPYTATTTAVSQRRDAIQTTAASQPRIVNAGSVESENGKPSIFFDGTDDRLATSAAVITSSSFSTFSVFSSLSAVGAAISGQHNGGLDVYRTLFTGSDAVEIGKANFAYAGPSSSYAIRTASSDVFNGTDSVVFTGSNNGLMSIGFRGVIENTLSAPAWTPLNTPLSIGSFGGATPSAFIAGRIQELSYYPTYQTSYQSISSNMNTYYGSYWQGNGTALLDSFSGASAAYSLRNLSSAYTGPLIRVRRSSDNVERDIYGTFRGDLDLAALTSFVGANSGFVTTWYDQSGLGRHATQATAASQPRIVNAGAVETKNGKPSVFFTANNLVTTAAFTGTAGTLINLSATITDPPTSGYGVPFGRIGNSDPLTSHQPFQDGAIYENFASNSRKSVGNPTNNTTNIYLYDVVSDSGLYSVRINNSSFYSTTTNTVLYNTNPPLIGTSGSYSFNGYISEIMVYTSNQSASLSAIASNINNYYKIY
jgi:hypothetical protein